MCVSGWNVRKSLFIEEIVLPLQPHRLRCMLTNGEGVLPQSVVKQGEVAEWSIAAVLKTVDLHGSGGSNPSLSALSTLAAPLESTTKRIKAS